LKEAQTKLKQQKDKEKALKKALKLQKAGEKSKK
jgi:hypothetical protein